MQNEDFDQYDNFDQDEDQDQEPLEPVEMVPVWLGCINFAVAGWMLAFAAFVAKGAGRPLDIAIALALIYLGITNIKRGTE